MPVREAIFTVFRKYKNNFEQYKFMPWSSFIAEKYKILKGFLWEKQVCLEMEKLSDENIIIIESRKAIHLTEKGFSEVFNV